MLRNMKDSMRKKPAKADVTSESGETTVTTETTESSNPWANEESTFKDSLSRQVSVVSKTSEVTTATKASSEDAQPKVSISPHVEVPTSGPEESLNATKGRRKKTITKPTPHTFELEDELKKPKQSKQPKQPDTVQLKKDSSPNGVVQAERVKKPSPLSYSSIYTNANIQPIEPPPKASKRKSEKIPNNPFTSPASHARQQSYSSTNGSRSISYPAPTLAPYHFIPSTKPLSDDFFNSKVIVITHGASLISSSLIRRFHAAGCRVIFGDPSPDRARKLISSLGPPDIVHFNKCELGKYNDVLDLFRLATTMYGRVDHAIFGVGDDGAQAATVGTAENLWKLGDNNITVKSMIEEVKLENKVDGLDIGDIVSASIHFTKIAIPYLRKGLKPDKGHVDKSLTFVTSSASFNAVPRLPIYQITQHAVLGTIRATAETLDPVKDGIRVNGVVTNIMIPTIIPQAGGRMSVQLPHDRPEDVSRVVLGVVGSASSGLQEEAMHGRILYVTGEGGFDIQEGLVRSEASWMGIFGKEAFDRAHAGFGNGSNCQWMLMDGLGIDV